MKKIIVALMTTVLAINAQVTLPHYDGMDYPAATALQTQTGWAAVNTGDDLAIASGSLSFPSLVTSIGNKVQFAGGGIDAVKLFTNQTTGTVYYSFLLNVTSAAGVTDPNGGYFAGFVNSASTTGFGGCVWLKRDTDAKYFIGLSARSSGSTPLAQYTTASYDINAPHLIVVSYQIVDGATNDMVNMWIDPVPGQVAGTPDFTITNTSTNGDLADVAQFLIRQDSATETPAIEMDEIRIANTWSEVTPSGSAIDNNNTALSNVVISAYPNPFNPTTSISFTLPQALNGSLTVYNQAGQKVTELFNGQMNQGLNSFQFNAADLNSGVYFCKLVSGTNSFTHKMVLTK